MADALSTRLMIKMLLKKNFITVLLYTECYAALLIRFSIARYTILRMKPIVQVFQEKIILDSESSAYQKFHQNSTNFIDFVTAMLYTFTHKM